MNIQKLSKVLRHSRISNYVIRKHGFGLFDGGCVMLAFAISRVVKKPVMTVYGSCQFRSSRVVLDKDGFGATLISKIHPQHAVVIYNGYVLDGLGATLISKYDLKIRMKESMTADDYKTYRASHFDTIVDEKTIEWITKYILKNI